MSPSQIQPSERHPPRYRRPEDYEYPLSFLSSVTFHKIGSNLAYILGDSESLKVDGESLVEFCKFVEDGRISPTYQHRLDDAARHLFYLHLHLVGPFLKDRFGFPSSGNKDQCVEGRLLDRYLISPECAGDPVLASVLSALSNHCPRKTKVIVVASYVTPWLGQLETLLESMASERFMLFKPYGEEPWIGPIFRKEDVSSIRQLLLRISENFPIDSFIAQRTGRPPIRSRLVRIHPEDFCAASQKLIEQVDVIACATKMFSIDTKARTLASHDFIDCKHGATLGQELRSSAHASAQWSDGGNRQVTAPELIARLQPLLSHITGLVPRPVSVSQTSSSFVYVASQVFPVASLLKSNRAVGLRLAAAGKGECEDQALASCIGEAIERYSACYQGSETSTFCSLLDRPDDTIHPNAIMQYSERQYLNRDYWNSTHGFFHYVPESFDETEIIEWSTVVNYLTGVKKLVPTSLVYFNYYESKKPMRIIAKADSNGCASGATLDEAVLQGVYELIERDACAIWWYNRLCMPEIDTNSISSVFVKQSFMRYCEIGRDLRLIDLTNDLGIPVVLAVSTLIGSGRSICVGLGCNLSYTIACSRAICELDQFVAMFGAEVVNNGGHSGNRELDIWLATATIADHPFMQPKQPTSSGERLLRRAAGASELQTVVDVVNRIVGPVYICDISRNEAVLSAVRVIVPGLRHFWARFAPGRLYEVPVKMNWRERELLENELNPMPFFL